MECVIIALNFIEADEVSWFTAVGRASGETLMSTEGESLKMAKLSGKRTGDFNLL